MQFSPHQLQGGQGTGLGLYMSKGVMDLHDGSIGVDSAGEGLGASFYIELPVEDLRPAEAPFEKGIPKKKYSTQNL